MKFLGAITLACLLGAVVFALLPSEEPVLPPPAQLKLEPIAEADPVEPELFTLAPQAEEAEEELGVLEGEEFDDVPGEVSLTGRVNPQSGAQPPVNLVFQSDCPEPDECEPNIVDTEADPDTGEFEVTLSPGTWRLVARADGFLPAYEEGLSVVAGEELGDIVLTLERGERITGTVVEEGVPQESVQVAALIEGYVRTTTTDELGHFELEGLPHGTYRVRAYNGHSGGDEKIAPSGSVVNLDLGHREKIYGRVVDARGFPVEGATIFSDYTPVPVVETDPFPTSSGAIYGLGAHGCAPSPACYQRAISGPDGRFEIDGAPGETLAVGARLGDLTAIATEVVPGAGDPITLALGPGTKVQLLDDEGKPAPNVELELFPHLSFFNRPSTTDAAGFVELPLAGLEEVVLPTGVRFAQGLPKDIKVLKPEPELIIY